MMKATIVTISSNGYTVIFETPEADLAKLLPTLARIETQLGEAGYQANAVREYPKTPTGEPICPKHGEPMRLREKQGDEWYSHTVTAPDGSKHYCRGHAGKSSPGWDH